MPFPNTEAAHNSKVTRTEKAKRNSRCSLHNWLKKLVFTSKGNYWKCQKCVNAKQRTRRAGKKLTNEELVYHRTIETKSNRRKGIKPRREYFLELHERAVANADEVKARLKLRQKIRHSKLVENLEDAYIKVLLLPIKNPPAQAVELKRSIMKVKRATRQSSATTSSTQGE